MTAFFIGLGIVITFAVAVFVWLRFRARRDLAAKGIPQKYMVHIPNADRFCLPDASYLPDADSDWTLSAAARTIEPEAWTITENRLGFNYADASDKPAWCDVLDESKRFLWDQAEQLLRARYPFMDMGNLAYELQAGAIDGTLEDDEDEDDDFDEAEYKEYEDAYKEDAYKGASEDDDVPSADELNGWYST